MSGPSRRELERRVEDLGVDPDEIEVPPEWRPRIPRELWSDMGQAWYYDLTRGESHPHLPSPDELADRR